MKRNKIHKRAVSVLMVTALAVTIFLQGFTVSSIDVLAATMTTGDDLVASDTGFSSSSYWTASTITVGNSTSYTFGSTAYYASLSKFYGTSGTTGYVYWNTSTTFPAGTYNISFTAAGSGITFYPYLNGQLTSTSSAISSSASSWSSAETISLEFTLSSATTGYMGVYAKSTSTTSWADITDISITYEGNASDYSYSGYTKPTITASLGSSSVTYPSTISIELAADSGVTKTDTVSVTWTNTSAVDLNTQGTYTIYGTFTYSGTSYSCEGTVIVQKTGSGTADFAGVTYKGVLVNGGDWIKGADVSTVISLEAAGVTYYDSNGNEEDLIKIMADAGVNCIRVRVWNDPYRSGKTKTAANSYGGGVCDLDYCVQIAERCAKYGVKLFVSFHYSDWWSDPSRSIVPKAWSGYTVAQKAAACSTFTTESLEQIAATGVDIEMVSVGNETTNYMSGESSFSNIATIMKSGCEAVRAFDPDILIALHFTNPETWNFSTAFASTLNSKGVDYDVFSTSYYSYWHGTLANLETKLEAVANTYGKLVMITEYSHPYTTSDLDGSSNTMSSSDMTTYIKSTFGEASESGQYSAIQNLNDYCAGSITNCIGTFYWEPAWVAVSSSKWATYGCGWTTAYSSEYDSSNGSSSVGGSGCENQALFNATTYKPLKSITDEVFNDVWTDGYEPILGQALAQASSVSSGYYNIRFVGNIDALSYDSAGFKIEVYDSSGTIVKSLAKKPTANAYHGIMSSGTMVEPSSGYYFTYCFRNVPASTTYYFKVIPYATSYEGTSDNHNNYQTAYKYYKCVNGNLTVVSSIGE
ncbi:MAG: glycosyl hydrolase 53 family protein [Eubacterium sp.]